MTTTINWKKIPGNKSMQKLHPLMLTDEGYARKRKFSVGRGIESREYLIIYDKDYVFFRFSSLIEELKFEDVSKAKNFLAKLISALDNEKI